MYVILMYTWLNPCIKGMHLTVDSWHPGRAGDGFKWTAREKQRRHFFLADTGSLPCRREEEDLEDQSAALGAGFDEESAPETVTPVDYYSRDLVCLRELTSLAKPPKQLYGAVQQSVFFVIGDASGKGKGNAVVAQYGVDYKSGAWNLEWREKSSNCLEAENLTDQLECLVADGLLRNHKVFLVTDNSAFEEGYYKGRSPLRELLDIVFQVHKAQRNGGFILHVIHISGKQMKVSGVVVLSRGDLIEGMMAGRDPLLFIPFNKGADDLLGGRVLVWIRSWW
jgi:hypothetical protein